MAGQARADANHYRLQRAAQRLLTYKPEDWREVATADGTLKVPVHRIATCHRWSHGPGPGLWRSPAGDNAEFSDVHTCGSVWMCPVCGPKITSGRRLELVAAVGAWTDRGGQVYLATRTFSHDKHSRTLPELVKLLAGALSRAKAARRARGIAERAGVVGTIRALEPTHGELNGWHPHTHELIFARPGERARLLSHRNGWIRLLIKRGMAGMSDTMTRAERAEQLRFLRRHAYTVQDGTFAADYVAKFGMEPETESGGRWGHASELTRGHLKSGGQRLTGRTPFTLLAMYCEGDKRAGMLFRDFALAFAGRSQLYWSPALRASLAELCEAQAAEIYYRDGQSELQRAWAARARCIAREQSDDDLASTRAPECTEFAHRFTTEDWRLVLRTDSRADVKLAAQLDGTAGVLALLERLRGERATHGDYHVADMRRFNESRGWRHEFGRRDE